MHILGQPNTFLALLARTVLQHPDLSHGWSVDGINWDWSPAISGPPNHLAVGGGDNERPRVALDESGDIDFLYVGQLGVDPAHTDGARTAAFRALKA